MKGFIICLITIFLASCYTNTEVVEYRQVAVAPVASSTVVRTCYYDTCGSAYINNQYGARSNFYDYDYDYYDSPVDVTTTSIVNY